MATLQYGRKFALVIGTTGGAATDYSALHCVFTVRRGDFQTPNACDARIYNLSNNTANAIRAAFLQGVKSQQAQAAAGQPISEGATGQIAIQAGYESNFGLIFTGNVKQVRLGRVDAKDSYVDVTAADGDQAYNFAPIAQSIAAGSSPAATIATCLQALQGSGASISQGYMPALPVNGSARGRVFYGMTRDEIRDFAKTQELVWSIQDGQLTLVPETSYIAGQVPLISPQTGLIGVPEQTQNGIEMDVLINPSIKIGQRVQLQSNAINQYRYGLDAQSQASNALLARTITTSADGTYYVMRAEHRGDTRGNPWYTHLICLAVDASVTPTTLVPSASAATAIARY